MSDAEFPAAFQEHYRTNTMGGFVSKVLRKRFKCCCRDAAERSPRTPCASCGLREISHVLPRGLRAVPVYICAVPAHLPTHAHARVNNFPSSTLQAMAEKKHPFLFQKSGQRLANAQSTAKAWPRPGHRPANARPTPRQRPAKARPTPGLGPVSAQ